MIDKSDAEAFAKEWIDAWNSHDLVRILSHYSDSIVFHSPRIALILKQPLDCLTGKDALATYWGRALAQANDLHFTFERLYLGSDSITIAYRNHRGQSAAETFTFDTQGLVMESIATYG
ncbi:MAG: nuclear transport factor 2 family protein [Micropepsaceae bacterium]